MRLADIVSGMAYTVTITEKAAEYLHEAGFPHEAGMFAMTNEAATDLANDADTARAEFVGVGKGAAARSLRALMAQVVDTPSSPEYRPAE